MDSTGAGERELPVEINKETNMKRHIKKNGFDEFSMNGNASGLLLQATMIKNAVMDDNAPECFRAANIYTAIAICEAMLSKIPQDERKEGKSWCMEQCLAILNNERSDNEVRVKSASVKVDSELGEKLVEILDGVFGGHDE